MVHLFKKLTGKYFMCTFLSVTTGKYFMCTFLSVTGKYFMCTFLSVTIHKLLWYKKSKINFLQ